MKKVFFNLRTSSRERMWDTAREAARVCEPIIPALTQQTSVARSQSYQTKRFGLMRRIKNTLRQLPLLNYQTVSGSDEADILYMWGAFPKGSTKPFIIELDNPFVLTYYSQWAFSFRRQAIKRKLRQAQKITFMSATARNHALELLGQEFATKCEVLPPFMADNYKTNKRPEDGLVRFLFVGLGFRRKGGPELLAAFAQLDNLQARLTVISHVDDETIEKYKFDTRITFLPPQPRDVLFCEYYPTHDIFVFPSMLETLGVVILEALSFGMGIITTDVYATPEMVKDGKNGRLLKHPFLEAANLNGVPTIDAVSIPRLTFDRKYVTNTPAYSDLISSTLIALECAMLDNKGWQEESRSLFKESFAAEIWKQQFQHIIINSFDATRNNIRS